MSPNYYESCAAEALTQRIKSIFDGEGINWRLMEDYLWKIIAISEAERKPGGPESRR